jgi:hypothetical protein
MTLKSFFGDGGIGRSIFQGAKSLGQSSATGISAAAGTVQGAVAPNKAKLESFWPTQKGSEYLEELQSSGQIQDENHWVFQLLNGQGQTTQAYLNRMMSEHNYKGSRNQLIKNINEMLSAGYITANSQQEEEEVSF